MCQSVLFMKPTIIIIVYLTKVFYICWCSLLKHTINNNDSKLYCSTVTPAAGRLCRVRLFHSPTSRSLALQRESIQLNRLRPWNSKTVKWWSRCWPCYPVFHSKSKRHNPSVTIDFLLENTTLPTTLNKWCSRNDCCYAMIWFIVMRKNSKCWPLC